MTGTVIMIVILAVAPVLILMGTTLVAVVLGWSVNAEVDARHEGSELLDLAYKDASSLT